MVPANSMKQLRLCNGFLCRYIRTAHSKTSNSQQNSARYTDWPIRVSVLLTRFPRITSDVSDLHGKFQQLRDQLEVKKSKLSNHEIDLQKKSSTKNIVTAKDFEIAQQQKYDLFTPASRFTDEENEQKSLNKKLCQKLVLVIKDPSISERHYNLPSTSLQEGESLRIAAERCLLQNCGTSIRAKFWSNAPSAVMCRTISKFSRQKLDLGDAQGVNDFIFLVNYDSHFASSNEDFAWITKEELSIYLRSRKLRAIVSDLMYEF